MKTGLGTVPKGAESGMEMILSCCGDTPNWFGVATFIEGEVGGDGSSSMHMVSGIITSQGSLISGGVIVFLAASSRRMSLVTLTLA